MNPEETCLIMLINLVKQNPEIVWLIDDNATSPKNRTVS